MKKLKNIPAQDRPRERLLNGNARSLADVELIAILLGKGTRKKDVLSLAQDVITIIDTEGLDITPADMMNMPGIGQAKACIIIAALEFARRRIKPEGLKIKFPADVLPLIRHYGDRKQEYMLCISINGANEVMNIRVVSIGMVNKTQAHPREVFADVIAERASGVILAHNHPVGDLQPSPEDKALTTSLKEAGKLLGIDLLDHIIFNREGYYSFLEHDLLP